MNIVFEKLHKNWAKLEHRRSVFFGIFLFFLSLVINHFASAYVNRSAVVYVPDLILDNIPVYNTGIILNYGAPIFVLFVIGFLIWEPKRISFAIKSTALFIVIRSLFIILTHLGPAPVISAVDQDNLFSPLILGNDFFFSGHTGLPFLLALVFWDNKIVRTAALSVSFIFGAAVLLGHLHYSIDVFSAFFISFSIYCLARYLFKNDFLYSSSA